MSLRNRCVTLFHLQKWKKGEKDYKIKALKRMGMDNKAE